MAKRHAREVVTAGLSLQVGINVVGTSAQGLTIEADLRTDVVVTSDTSTTPADQVVAEFRAVCPDAKIVMLLLSDRAVDLPANAGAEALVDASEGVDELVAAVRSVAR